MIVYVFFNLRFSFLLEFRQYIFRSLILSQQKKPSLLLNKTFFYYYYYYVFCNCFVITKRRLFARKEWLAKRNKVTIILFGCCIEGWWLHMIIVYWLEIFTMFSLLQSLHYQVLSLKQSNSGLTKPGEVGEILILYQLKSPSLNATPKQNYSYLVSFCKSLLSCK
jgi:hypothetical protein